MIPSNGCQEMRAIILILITEGIQDLLLLFEASCEISLVLVQHTVVKVTKMHLSAELTFSFLLPMVVASVQCQEPLW